METESQYLNRRSREERDAAARALDPKARELHLELAARYIAAADGGGTRRDVGVPHLPPQPGLPSEFRILE